MESNHMQGLLLVRDQAGPETDQGADLILPHPESKGPTDPLQEPLTLHQQDLEGALGKTKNPDAWKWRHNEAPHFDQLNQTQTHTKHLHQELFDALQGCTLAEIWKACCTRLFEDTDPSARATISKVWSRLIVSLAACLDTLIKRGVEGKIAKEKELWPFFRGRS
ncbi:hypothetical protein SELMODRAFT_402325 [Selaginella moellendorffii]|uniref:Uncharacterized protein n=1 Tax=Selaginella moellendorffii TaxID=88036 RepID=D8QQA2_SELML|nr:hypothetical protein SELMODRAFT_402325 [Selaginella moellendorffii]